MSRSPHDLPILAAVLAGVLAFAACDEAPAPEPAAPAIDGELPCSLPCAPGFACVDGGCVPACQPRCPAGTRCTEDGRCEAEAAIGGNPRNLCGGITQLDVEPGAPCGPCGDGRWLCATDDTLACVDPVGTNAGGGCGFSALLLTPSGGLAHSNMLVVAGCGGGGGHAGTYSGGSGGRARRPARLDVHDLRRPRARQ